MNKTIEASVAALSARLDAQDTSIAELKTDLRSVLNATTATNLSLAKLPTWAEVNDKDRDRAGEIHEVSTRVTSLETKESEQRGARTILIAGAGVLGAILTAVWNWIASKL